MQLPPLVPGDFLRRDNRFRVTVQVNGVTTSAHLPNSGKLVDLLTPGRPVWLTPAASPTRKTPYGLTLVELNTGLASVDARLPSPLFAEAVRANRLTGFAYDRLEREIAAGDSRLDFRLTGPTGTCWVETKSVTLVEEGVALFPDVPTARGRRHLLALADLHRQGDRAAVVFVIQRADAQALAPHYQADPAFAGTLVAVAAAGVEVRAFVCRVSRSAIEITFEVPVLL